MVVVLFNRSRDFIFLLVNASILYCYCVTDTAALVNELAAYVTAVSFVDDKILIIK